MSGSESETVLLYVKFGQFITPDGERYLGVRVPDVAVAEHGIDQIERRMRAHLNQDSHSLRIVFIEGEGLNKLHGPRDLRDAISRGIGHTPTEIKLS